MSKKYDVTDRSHDRHEPWKAPDIGSFLLSAGPGDRKTVLEHSKPAEISSHKWFGALLLTTTIFTSCTTTLALHVMFGDDGSFHPGLAAAGVLVGVLTGISDRVNFYLGGQHRRGIAQSRSAGLAIPTVKESKVKDTLIPVLRTAQAVTMGSLCGLFVLLAANSKDIDAHLRSRYLVENREAAAQGAKLADDNIDRLRKEIAALTSDIDGDRKDIRNLQTGDTRRSLAGGRKGALVPVSLEPKIGDRDRARREKVVERDRVSGELSKAIDGRNEAIAKFVSSSPNNVPMREGVPAKIQVLSAIAYDDPKMWFVIFGIEFVALLLELGPMLASSRINSANDARVAITHFVEVSKLVQWGAKELGATATGSSAPEPPSIVPAPPNDFAEGDHTNNHIELGAKPTIADALGLRRGRGRARRLEEQQSAANGEDHG